MPISSGDKQPGHFLGPSGKKFKNESGVVSEFSDRLWISTNNNWSSEAINELKNQTIYSTKLSLFDLESAPVDLGET
ncbi:MAG: hypothetical protein LBE31_02665 [Deltaproteobacteria bacterium]|nr:hypothetical protein [Deltaproteobacteria bacterium]